MWRTRLLPVLAALAIGCTSGARRRRRSRRDVASRKTITLSIVGTNDLHGGILQREDRGGLALLGGYVANLRAARARDGGAVLLIDAGDMFQGTLESNLTGARRSSPRTTRSATRPRPSATTNSTSVRPGRRRRRSGRTTIRAAR